MPASRHHASHAFLGCALGLVLYFALPALAQTIDPSASALEYHAGTMEDPAAKVCHLGVDLKDANGKATIKFQLLVARMKRDDVYAGPFVFGVRIEALDRPRGRNRVPGQPSGTVGSAVFVSENYTVATHPRTAPFEDGSWVASTLDSGDGSALVEAVASGKFQVAVTRRSPPAAHVYEVTSAPPLDMLWRFGGCIDVLQPTE